MRLSFPSQNFIENSIRKSSAFEIFIAKSDDCLFLSPKNYRPYMFSLYAVGVMVVGILVVTISVNQQHLTNAQKDVCRDRVVFVG